MMAGLIGVVVKNLRKKEMLGNFLTTRVKMYACGWWLCVDDVKNFDGDFSLYSYLSHGGQLDLQCWSRS